mmetsp:Transcript_28830/g.82774  ORF Transcript_28830/g.82774 Transcript_28830/m.82774 type:complete len:335 (-) Transcript_28830:1606-2610(-)
MMGNSVTWFSKFTPSFTTGTPRLSMECRQRITTSSMIDATCTLSRENLRLLLSCTRTFTSMILETMSRSRVAQLWMSCSGRSMDFGVSGPTAMVLLKPIIPWIGDFNSWLTVAIRLDFFSSISLMFVISWPTQIIPTMSPCGLNRGVALRSKHTGFSWPAQRSSNSKLLQGCVVLALYTTSSTILQLLSLMNSAMFRSTTSSFLHPDLLATQPFHSMMFMSTPTPKIGALAVSISCDRSSATRSECVRCSLSNVMSWPTHTTPMTLFSSSPGCLLGVALRSNSRRSPVAVTMASSKFSTSLPESTWSSMPCTSLLCERWMNCFTRWRPMAFSFE